MDHLPDVQVASSNLITNAANYHDNPRPRRPFYDDNAKNGCESADSNARNQLPASHASNYAANYRGTDVLEGFFMTTMPKMDVKVQIPIS